MDLQKLKEPLTIDQIDFRVQSINKGGYATILAYKDARADMNKLDESVGCLNWKREHTRENMNCVVSIWDKENNHWVSKEDTGTESMAEKQKGLASDSFKRACFNWGIGRELYDYPVISIKLNQSEKKDAYGEWYMLNDKPKQGYGLKIKEWKWISNFNKGIITGLAAKDNNGKVRFSWGTFSEENTKDTVEDKRPWLSEKLLNKGLERIKAGEKGVYEKMDIAFRINDEYKAKLKP